jgi:hypothetical protein
LRTEKEVIEKHAEHLYVFAISNIEAKIPSLSQLISNEQNCKAISIGEFKEEIEMARHFEANDYFFELSKKLYA